LASPHVGIAFAWIMLAAVSGEYQRHAEYPV
jgi:hypothetical protein